MAKKAKSAFSSMAVVFLLAVVWAGYMAFLKTGAEVLGLAGFCAYAWIKLFIKSKPLADEKSTLKFWRYLYEAGLLLVTGFLTGITRMKDFAATDGAMNILAALSAAMLLIFMAGYMTYFKPPEKSKKEPVQPAKTVDIADLQKIKERDAFTFNLMVVFFLGLFTFFYYEYDKLLKIPVAPAAVKPAAEKPVNASETAPKAVAEKQVVIIPKPAVKAGKINHAAKSVKQTKKNISKPVSTEEKELYPSGKVNIIWTKKNGINDGPYKRLYESGAIGQKGSYVKGAKDGDWHFYRENGFMWKTMVFDMDKLVLESSYAPKSANDPEPGKIEHSLQYVDGKLYRETIFTKGKAKTIKYYDKDGQVTSEDKL